MSRMRSGQNHRTAHRARCALKLAFIVATYHPVANGFEMNYTGRATVTLRDIEGGGGSHSQQQVYTGNITGFGYLWRPWFARTGLKLDLSHVISEQENGADSERTTEDNILSGEGRINFFPSSRFPTTLFADAADSRVETDSLLSVAEITTLRRERYGITQQYRPRSGKSRYGFQYLHSRVDENDGDNEESDEMRVDGTHSFSNNTVNYRLLRRDADIVDVPDQRKETSQSFNLSHIYQPARSFSIENTFDRTRELEQEVGQVTRDNFASLNSFMTWRPTGSKFTGRANLNLLRRESETNAIESLNDTAILSVGFNYEFTDALRMGGDMGRSRTTSNGLDTDRHFENVSLAYSPAPIPLGNWQYFWGTSVGIGNNGGNDTEDVQTANAGLRHGLSRLITNPEGPAVSVNLNQSYTRQQNTRETRINSLTHIATIAATWSEVGNVNRLQLTVSDSRTAGEEADEDDNLVEVDDTVQTLSLVASMNRATSRYASWTADASLGSTRVENESTVDRFTYGLISAGYNNNRWLDKQLLRFQSRIEYSVRESIPDDEDKTDETRLVWDNRVNYTIGLLDLSARLTFSGIDDDRTRTLVLSASRYFY